MARRKGGQMCLLSNRILSLFRKLNPAFAEGRGAPWDDEIFVQSWGLGSPLSAGLFLMTSQQVSPITRLTIPTISKDIRHPERFTKKAKGVVATSSPTVEMIVC